jgi:hypothetical protein
VPYNVGVEFIEASIFTKYVSIYLTEDEIENIPAHILRKIAEEILHD